LGYGDLVRQCWGSTSTFHPLGSLATTRPLTDADQDVTDGYIMRAFGTYRATTGSTLNNFRYIGQLGYYRETALSGFLLRRRYYAADVGRFLSRDPLGKGTDVGRSATRLRALMNREWSGSASPAYVHVANRPSNTRDPSGLFPCDDCLPNFVQCSKEAWQSFGKCLKDRAPFSLGADLPATEVSCALTGVELGGLLPEIILGGCMALMVATPIVISVCTDVCTKEYDELDDSRNCAYTWCQARCTP
jgi:RHS repeat-associated protein